MYSTELTEKHFEKNVVTAVIDALAPIKVDCLTPDEEIACVEVAFETLSDYPGIEALQRKVLKHYTAEHFILRAYLLLKGIILTKEAGRNSFAALNKDLCSALDCLQRGY